MVDREARHRRHERSLLEGGRLRCRHRGAAPALHHVDLVLKQHHLTLEPRHLRFDAALELLKTPRHVVDRIIQNHHQLHELTLGPAAAAYSLLLLQMRHHRLNRLRHLLLLRIHR